MIFGNKSCLDPFQEDWRMFLTLYCNFRTTPSILKWIKTVIQDPQKVIQDLRIYTGHHGGQIHLKLLTRDSMKWVAYPLSIIVGRKEMAMIVRACGIPSHVHRRTIGQATHSDNLLQPVHFCKSVLVLRPKACQPSKINGCNNPTSGHILVRGDS